MILAFWVFIAYALSFLIVDHHQKKSNKSVVFTSINNQKVYKVQSR